MLLSLRLLLVFALMACSHQTPLKGGLGQDIKKLSTQSSFGFIHGGHAYFFSLKEEKQENKFCNYYVGYVDGELYYQFPSHRLRELSNIYEKNDSPEERMALALKSIEEFSKPPLIPHCKTQSKRADEAAWAAVAIILWPVTLMAAGGWALQEMNDHFDEIYLGMPETQALDLLKASGVYKRREAEHDLYVADRLGKRMVMYFVKGHLAAFVRGKIPHAP